jgi:hypothetical protein
MLEALNLQEVSSSRLKGALSIFQQTLQALLLLKGQLATTVQARAGLGARAQVRVRQSAQTLGAGGAQEQI